VELRELLVEVMMTMGKVRQTPSRFLVGVLYDDIRGLQKR
jgi:hypothetical protein